MARLLQLPVTATFDAAEPWHVNLGAAFQDLVPRAVDNQPGSAGIVERSAAGPRRGIHRLRNTPGRAADHQRGAPAPGDLIKVYVPLYGRATVQQGSHEVALDPGELAVYDTGRPYQIRLDGAWTCAVMVLPRDAIGLSDSDLDRWMHRVYPATHGPGSVLSHFVVSAVADRDSGCGRRRQAR